MPKKIGHPEYAEQCALIEMLRLDERKYPELALIYAIPNDIRTTPQRAARAKKMGMRAGVPDLCLPVARAGFYGLYLEMKSVTGRLSAQQAEYGELLEREGYCFRVARDAHQARAIIKLYLANFRSQLLQLATH